MTDRRRSRGNTKAIFCVIDGTNGRTTSPYVIVLSVVGLFTYSVIIPAFTTTMIAPEWAWGLFAATGGILGAWCAAKTQRFVPKHLLKLMLGGITGLAGSLYVIGFFVDLPFKL